MAEKIVLDDKNLDVKPAHNNPGNTSSRDGVGQSTGNKSSRVFVGGVSQDTSEEDFRAYFAQVWIQVLKVCTKVIDFSKFSNQSSAKAK